MARPESQFPTLRNLRDRLSELVDEGFGEQPFQVVVVPDSTLQAIARAGGHDVSKTPALMIDLPSEAGRLPVCITSADRLTGRGMHLQSQ